MQPTLFDRLHRVLLALREKGQHDRADTLLDRWLAWRERQLADEQWEQLADEYAGGLI